MQRRSLELGESSADRSHRELLEAGEIARQDAIERSNTRKMRLKHSTAILKGCLYKMPDDPMEILVFFHYADRHFNTNHLDQQFSTFFYFADPKSNLYGNETTFCRR